MIQIAILVVLILIAIILAPWLIGVIAMAAAAYGAWVVGLGIAAGVGVVLGIGWGLVSAVQRKDPGKEAPPIVGERIICPHCQAEVPAHLMRCDNCRQPLR